MDKINYFFRTSSASEYSSTRDKISLQQNQHSLSKDLLAPMILGQIISLDDWVPERPPKPKLSINNNNNNNHNTSNNLPLRVPSPDLPPPPPPPLETPLHSSLIVDDALPLPPPEVLKQDSEIKMNHPPSRRNSFAGQGSSPPKMKSNNIPLSPPAIPMRPKISPTPIMTINSMLSKNYQQLPTQDQTVHAQRVILQKQTSESAVTATYGHKDLYLSSSPPRLLQGRISDSRLSVRKRAHNSSTSKDCIGYNNSAAIQHHQTPPPLKPRMRNQSVESVIQAQQNVFTPIAAAANNNKVR